MGVALEEEPEAPGAEAILLVLAVVLAGPVSVFAVSSLVLSLVLSPVRATPGEAEAMVKESRQSTAPILRSRCLRKADSFFRSPWLHWKSALLPTPSRNHIPKLANPGNFSKKGPRDARNLLREFLLVNSLLRAHNRRVNFSPKLKHG
jgi:hypothetical protein